MSSSTAKAAAAAALTKRCQTMYLRKIQEDAQLQEMENAPQPQRSAMSKALENAAWRGAAPMGNRKRAGSVTTASEPKPTKQLKSTTSSSKKLPRLCQTATTSGAHSTRRQPAVVVSDDQFSADSDTIETATASRMRTQSKPSVRVSDDEFNDHVEEGEDQGELEEGPNDLENLDSASLRSTLQHKRIRWKKQSYNESEEETEVAGANIPHNEVEVTTASEIEDCLYEDHASDDGAKKDTSQVLGSHRRKAPERHEVGRQAKAPLLASEDDEPLAPHKTKMPGKREIERRAEMPRWQVSRHKTKDFEMISSGNEGDVANMNLDAELDNDTISQSDDVNSGWGPEAQYIAGNGRIISIKAQPKVLATVIGLAIRTVTGDGIFKTAYPSADSVALYHRKTLVKAAKNIVGASEYVDRFKRDHNFGIIIGRVLSGCLSNYCSQVKTTALAKVEGFYNLTVGGPECKKKVESLLLQTTYIYPHHVNDGRLIETKPFHHPAIISTIRDMYFGSSRSRSLADKHNKQFQSSIGSGLKKDEKELPAAMVAMVATAIHSSLDDYSTGIVLKTEFKADLYEDVYKGHIEFLETIRDGNPPGYHRLMADLYALTSSVSSHRSATVTNNAIALLNLAAMDV